MKKLPLLFFSFIFTHLLAATNIAVPTAGELGNLLTPTLKANITELVLSGTIDARDIKCLRDELPRLTILDMGAVSIQAYSGEGGTQVNGEGYPANEMPNASFFNRTTYDGKTTLKVIVLPSSITSIGHFAFYHCYNLTSAVIPSAVSSIGDYAFNFCGKLPSINIPVAVTSIGKYCFSACSAISGFTVHPDNPNFSAIEGVLYDKNQTALIECPESKQGAFIIPFTVKTVANNAFFQCSKLTTLSIPSSVESIGNQAFYNCSALTAIYCYPLQPVELKGGSPVFFNVNKTSCKFQVFVGSAPAYQTAPVWKEFANIDDSKTVTVTAGNLSAALTTQELKAVTKLIVKGSLDARDFKSLRDAMPALAMLDLSAVSILSYSGLDGTDPTLTTYSENEIPHLAFYNGRDGKSSLTKVLLPVTCSVIGKNSFTNCTKISSITFPKSINRIENEAFDGCQALLKFVVETGNTSYSIIDGVLYDKNFTSCVKCPAAKKGSCQLPNTVTKIEPGAFNNCNALTSIQLGIGFAKYPSAAFGQCTALEKFVVPENHPTLSVLDGVVFNKNRSILIAYPPAKQNFYFVPTSANRIEESAFAGALGLTSISIPNSVHAIGNKAFYDCTKLNSIFVYNTLPIDLGAETAVFFNVNKNSCVLHVPTGLAASYQSSAQWGEFASILDALTVNSSAGELKSALTPQEIKSVTKLTVTGTLDARDFKLMRDSMPALSVLDISAVTVLGYTGTGGTLNTSSLYPPNLLPQNSFFNGKLGKTSLTSITLPNFITSIGANAFAHCTELSRMKIPASVTSIALGAFDDCAALSEIQVAEENQNYSAYEGVLCNKEQSTILLCPMAKTGTFLLPERITTIANKAFEGCKGLTTFRIGSAVKTIGTSAFHACSGLNKIEIPASVNSIGNQAFANCTALNEFVVDPENQHFISMDGVLLNKKRTILIACPALKKGAYSIPASVNQISDYAFSSCSALTELKIGNSVKSIGTQAFDGCIGLQSIHLEAAQPLSFANAMSVFKEVNTSSCVLHVPVGAVPSYRISPQWQEFSNISDVKIISVTAGGLSAALTAKELSSITQLVVSGTLDARDFNCLRDSMPALTVLDISAVNVKSYKGEGGTLKTSNSYPSNELPVYAFGTDSVAKMTLHSIQLPSSLTAIPNSAFSRCAGLKSISIPTGVNTIPNTTFSACVQLEQIQVAPDNRNFASLEGVLFNKNKTILILYPKAKKGAYAIPTTVASIAENAFSNCPGLTELRIPKTVNLIRTQAFAGCVGLREIFAFGINPIMLKHGSTIFAGVNKSGCVLHVPVGSVKGYRNAQQWQDFDTVTDEIRVEIAAGGLSAAVSAEDKALLSSLQISGKMDARDLRCIRDEFPMLISLNLQGVSIQAYKGEGGTEPTDLNYAANEMPHYSFCNGSFGNDKLKNVILPANLTSIADNAFSFCNGLENIQLPASLQSMGDAAFLYCSSLKTIALPEAVTRIGRSAFYRCGALRSISMGNKVGSIGKEAFLDCAQLDSVNLSRSLQIIENRAFSGCTRLRSILLPPAVRSIGCRVFVGCAALTEVLVHPENVSYSSLDGVLFNAEKELLIHYPRGKVGAYSVPNSVKEIGDFAFFNCKTLTEITLPNTLHTIGGWAFSHCTALKKIVLPSSLNVIENQAFAGCSSLNFIELLAEIPIAITPGSELFLEVDKTTCRLKVPVSAVKTYQLSNPWRDFVNIVR